MSAEPNSDESFYKDSIATIMAWLGDREKFEFIREFQSSDEYFESLSDLEELKDRHYRNAITSLEFLKELLKLARETVALERETKAEPVDNSKEALIKLFEEARVEKTPVMIKQIVEDIDEVVKVTRFDGWQWTIAGEREIQKALRKTLLKYQLHKDQDLFDKAYQYIREHY
jgi:type I restriction enzyme R subunit